MSFGQYFTEAYIQPAILMFCLAGVPYFLYRGWRDYRRDHARISVKGAGGKVFMAVMLFFILKSYVLVPQGFAVVHYDGETGFFTIPNAIGFNETVELSLRFDPEIGGRIWMAKDSNGDFYPFFVERIEDW